MERSPTREGIIMTICRIHSAEFKRDAVQLARSSGNLSATARDPGISVSLFRKWRNAQQINGDAALSGGAGRPARTPQAAGRPACWPVWSSGSPAPSLCPPTPARSSHWRAPTTAITAATRPNRRQSERKIALVVLGNGHCEGLQRGIPAEVISQHANDMDSGTAWSPTSLPYSS